MRSNLNQRRHRRGSALLVCTLAAAVLSMATLAILRSQQYSVRRVDAVRSSVSARMTSEGLTQRAIAMLRTDPKLTTKFKDERSKDSPAIVVVEPISADESRIDVYLYEGAQVPATSRIVNVTELLKKKP